METEFTGSRRRAACLEAWQLPFPTLLFRLRWEAAKRLGLHKKRYEPSGLTAADVLSAFPLLDRSPAGLLAYFRSRGTVGFWCRRGEFPGIRQAWQQRLPHARLTLSARAEQVCRHEFAFLGSPLRRFGSEIDWHDEMSGRGRWPLRHWSSIDIRSSARVGDIKLTWELNRCQFFVTLARAYVLLQDERYAEELTKQIRSWIDQNPSEMGVNWQSNLECAIRSISWLFAMEMTLDSPAWGGELLVDVVRCLMDHQRHLDLHLTYSAYCMPGNHLLGDALGLAVLSLYLPELPQSRGYLDRACEVLFREASRQNLPDGPNFENAISYHRFVFYMYFLLARLLEENQRPVPPLIWERLERMCEFVVHMRCPGGQMAQVGDWDNGRTVILDDSDVRDFNSMLCIGAIRFARPDLKAAAGQFREEALWLLGPGAAERFDKLAASAGPTDKAFPTGGYYTWRSDWGRQAEYALFKCAPFEAHTHADNLTLLYSAGGQDWIVDRGTYTYNGDWAWRTYFRGTRSHNAVVIDGLGQALAHRAFRWIGKPCQQVHRYYADERFGYVVGTTTGFSHLRSPVKHARSVLLVRGEYVLVLDALHAISPHDYELLWHFAPGLRPELVAGECAIRVGANDGQQLLVAATGSSPLTLEITEGQTDPIQGWHSGLYGEKEPAPTLVYRARGVGPLLMVSLIRLLKDSHTDDLRPALAPGSGWNDLVCIDVTGATINDRVGMPNPVRLSCGAFPADALYLDRGGLRIPIGRDERPGAGNPGGGAAR